MLAKDIRKFLDPSLCLELTTYKKFLDLLKTGSFVKSTNPKHHFCVFFIPYNPVKKEILIVDHKKAKQWVVPGGHVEEGESLEDAVKREAMEELNWKIEKIRSPFFISIMEIRNAGEPCEKHYDIWFCMPTVKELVIDMKEFNNTKWVTCERAGKMITHPLYKKALATLQKNIV